MKLFKSLTQALKQPLEVEALKISLDEKFADIIFTFPELKELYLEGDCRKFPKIGNPWPNLRVLSIKWPSFDGDLSGIFNLPRLENLKIIETPLKQILLPLGFSVSPIKSLTLKNCELSQLPEEISMLTSVTEMNLSGNKLTSLPHSFSSLRNLKRLNLDQNEFSLFPEAFSKMPNLSHLSIDGNPFSEDEKARIQREFNIWL